MPKTYDSALRDRVVGAVDRGLSARAAAARFEVGVATAIRWARCFRKEGTHADPPRRKYRSKLDDHAAIATEREQGDVAIARWFWHREQGTIEPRKLVFVDETGTATNMVPPA